MRPTDLKYYEKELYQLLDVKANRELVDFDEFVALVGLKKDSSAAHKECHHSISTINKKDPNGTKKRREDAKFVMRLLISHGVRVAGMRYEFQAAATPGRTPPGTIQSAPFVSVLG